MARGISRFQMQILVFGLSAFFTGLAGGLYAAHFNAIGPGVLSFSQLFFIIAMVVVGGTGRLWGPLVGAIVLVAADEMMREIREFRARARHHRRGREGTDGERPDRPLRKHI